MQFYAEGLLHAGLAESESELVDSVARLHNTEFALYCVLITDVNISTF
jgi:hypothetical protein